MASENDVTLTAVDESDNIFTYDFSWGAATSLTVDIWVTKLDYNIDKTLINIAVPRPSDKDYSFDNLDNMTWLIDLGRIKEVISIAGNLVDESSSSAKQKRDILLQMAKNFKRIKITWGGDSDEGGAYRKETLYGNINKLMITETAGITGDSQPSGFEQEKNYTIQLSIIIGTNKMI